MLDSIISFWGELPFIIKFPLQFWFGIIILRGVVAKDITSWLEDRGFIKKGRRSIIYRTLDNAYVFVSTIGKHLLSDRKKVIFQHYKTHDNSPVQNCNQDQCSVFTAN